MHDQDREKASSLVKNLVLPQKEEVERNPYFNKKPDPEPSLNLHAKDLLSIA